MQVLYLSAYCIIFFFFFQAEDGIRDSSVTGVQTCALPILLQSSEKFAEAGRDLAEHGGKVGEVTLDLGSMMGRKDKVVTTLTRGVEFLFRKNKVNWLKGKGRIPAPGRCVLACAHRRSQEIQP